MLMESTIQPSMVLHVDHEQSPASSFLSERTSLRCLVYCRSRGRNTLSSVWKSVRQTWRQRCCGPYASPMKSSTNMSAYAISFDLGRRRCGSRVNLVCSAYSGGAVCVATASARSSSLCGLLGWWERRDLLARSATVSLTIHNKGKDFFQPMGNVKGVVTSGSLSALLWKISPRLGASSGHNPMR